MRWSLAGAGDHTLEQLHDYIEAESFATFAGLAGLRFKLWSARPGEWFEGTYVFVDDAARASFQSDVEAHAGDLAGTRIIGTTPQIEAFETVAVVRGPSGFRSSPRFERHR